MRPLAIGDLFNSTFTIYKRNFGQFVLLGLIPSIVSLAVALAGIALLAAALPTRRATRVSPVEGLAAVD